MAGFSNDGRGEWGEGEAEMRSSDGWVPTLIHGSQISLDSSGPSAFPYEEHADPENGEDGWDDP